ncbi:MAG: hypothetical protein AAGA46_00300 [Cyanobacteria bacterium P01_F01_bin.13]
MPLPTTPSTEETWMTALVAYLATETAITWRHSPIPPTVQGDVSGAVWTQASLGLDRPNIFGDTTRDKVLSVFVQIKSDLADGPALQARWEQYIIDLFKGLQRTGIPSQSGAFLGVKPHSGGEQGGAWVFSANNARNSNASSAVAAVDYTLEFRYVFKLPGLPSC